MHGNVADFILAQLGEWGVERIYGVLGDAIFPLMDAFTRQSKIEFISATNETAAAFMASYEARLTGRLTVCTATSGPGTVNLLNGLADAYLDGSPVLAITGQVETKKSISGQNNILISSCCIEIFLNIQPCSLIRPLLQKYLPLPPGKLILIFRWPM
ncbi:MAG: thiamine pyrophosphate-binding protein [Candidatus Syntrophopropionicum ammoniitolerans]